MTFAPGSKLKVIGPECFLGAGLERMAIPKSVEKMQRSAFEGCGSLEEVVFEEGSKLETIQNKTFNWCRNLARIDLPDGLESIDYDAFSYCKSLNNIQLPEGLKKIGIRCFAKSGLEEIILPASIKEVCAEAF